MSRKKTLISQKDNYTGNFGLAFRSSAIFYAKNNDQITTTISFLNYWSLKRNLKVNIVINVREMNGTLVDRQQAEFANGMVINFTPSIQNFEGSIEVEVFSLENMVIPYAAVMAIYETKESISMVHSYARIYSHHEIEENRTITNGRESCWTIRSSGAVRPFCVMHNGPGHQNEQISKIVITAEDNERYAYDITIPKLNAYESYKINLDEVIDDLGTVLNGAPGNASISFELNNSFTRLLVGNEDVERGEFQITHSNFNYLEHSTDICDESNKYAYMPLVHLPEKNLSVVVYPDMEAGEYTIKDGNMTRYIKSKERFEYTPASDKQIFSSNSNRLPTRIVTAINGGSENKLPFECSLGVIHAQRPPKRLYWGLASADSDRFGRLFITVIDDIYGPLTNTNVIIRLYSSNKSNCLETIVPSSEIIHYDKGIPFNDIFYGCNNFLNGAYGYYTVSSEYPGLFVYSSIQNRNDSFTIEHGF